MRKKWRTSLKIKEESQLMQTNQLNNSQDMSSRSRSTSNIPEEGQSKLDATILSTQGHMVEADIIREEAELKEDGEAEKTRKAIFRIELEDTTIITGTEQAVDEDIVALEGELPMEVGISSSRIQMRRQISIISRWMRTDSNL